MSTTTVPGGTILISDKFASGDYTAWNGGSVATGCPGLTTIGVVASPIAGYTKASQHHYEIPSGQCSAHQDNNVHFDFYFAGQTTLYVSEHIRFATPRVPNSTNEMRKLFYVCPNCANLVYAVLTMQVYTGGEPAAGQLIVATQNGMWYEATTSMNYDTDYCLEMLLVQNTTGSSANGSAQVWVNGTRKINATSIKLIPNPAPWTQILLGEQADRNSGVPVNETRYITGVQIANYRSNAACANY